MPLRLLLLVALFYGCGGAPEARRPLEVPSASPESAALLAPAPRLRRAAPTVGFTLTTSQPETDAQGRLRFWLVALLSPPAGAHLYWKHAGETGLPTRVDFFVPNGFELGEVQYPGPTRFRSESGRIGYGYQGQVAIMAEVLTPAPSDTSSTGSVRSPDTWRLQAAGSWLSCDERCVKEEDRAHVDWPRAAGEIASQATLQAWRDLLPIEPEGSDWQATSRDGHTLLVQVPPEWTILAVFPEHDLHADDRDLAPAAPVEGLRTHEAAYHLTHVPPSVVVKAQSPQLARYLRLHVNTRTGR